MKRKRSEEVACSRRIPSGMFLYSTDNDFSREEEECKFYFTDKALSGKIKEFRLTCPLDVEIQCEMNNLASSEYFIIPLDVAERYLVLIDENKQSGYVQTFITDMLQKM